MGRCQTVWEAGSSLLVAAGDDRNKQPVILYNLIYQTFLVGSEDFTVALDEVWCLIW